ncbi:hypothetical protein ACWGOE_04200 [Leucobacter chromiiresistens]
MHDNEQGAATEVRGIVDEVIAVHVNQIGTHYESCYLRHAGCLAVRLRDELGPKSAAAAGPMPVTIAARQFGKNNTIVEQLLAAAAGRNIEVTVQVPITEATLTHLIRGRTAPQAARAIMQHMIGASDELTHDRR